MSDPEITIAITDRNLIVREQSKFGATIELLPIEQPPWEWEVFAMIRSFYFRRFGEPEGIR